MTPATPYRDPGRPAEIETISNRLVIHPISVRLVPPLQRLGVHPNLVSMMGLVAGLAATPAVIYLDPLPGAVAAFLCLGAWLICDGADGKLARATGKASPAGRIIDGIADYSVFIMLYTVVAFAAEPQYGAGVLWLAALAGASHIVQAASYEAQRERYVAWTSGRHTKTLPSGTPAGRAPFPLSLLETGYELLQIFISGRMPERASIEASDDDIARLYRDSYLPLIKRWGILSANCHVGAILLCVLAGKPEAYFVVETVVMNAALAALVMTRKRVGQDFQAALAQLQPATDGGRR